MGNNVTFKILNGLKYIPNIIKLTNIYNIERLKDK